MIFITMRHGYQGHQHHHANEPWVVVVNGKAYRDNREQLASGEQGEGGSGVQIAWGERSEAAFGVLPSGWLTGLSTSKDDDGRNPLDLGALTGLLFGTRH